MIKVISAFLIASVILITVNLHSIRVFIWSAQVKRYNGCVVFRNASGKFVLTRMPDHQKTLLSKVMSHGFIELESYADLYEVALNSAPYVSFSLPPPAYFCIDDSYAVSELTAKDLRFIKSIGIIEMDELDRRFVSSVNQNSSIDGCVIK